jgi:cytochrome oxidase Cu insertion factor (SCO1/SenC/PrrC family)
MMNRTVSFLFSMIICVAMLLPANAYAQPIPSFQMQLTNGKSFSSQALSKNKPLIIVYFAPDCDHCLVLMDTLLKKMNQFKTSQIILVTFKPVSEVVAFEKKYGISKYPNITLGIETPIFFFRQYYRVMNTPFTALYDKNGKLVVTYRKETPVNELARQLKQLK